MSFQFCAARTITLLGLAWIGPLASATSLTVQVSDAAGQPLTDVAVYAEAATNQTAPKPQRPVSIEQKGRKFSPLVTVIQAGSEISFPNNDTVRHHVYSFSPAKIFELKLYSGVPGNPVLFDKPGTVVVGCNIHDQMVAYIHIVTTPYFAKTDASGKARLDGLPPGKYQLKAWHYNLPTGSQTPEQQINFSGTETTVSFKLNIKSDPVTN
jgi:plastocyanin